MTLYFAYGANMDPVHMGKRCPGARRLGLAVLPDHEFTIARKGYGNASPAPGKELPGVLWDITPEDEAALDRFEGVPEGMYRQEHAVVRDPAGGLHRAMLYCPTDPAMGVAVPGYLERIIEVAELLQFPERYIAELQRWLPAGHRVLP